MVDNTKEETTEKIYEKGYLDKLLKTVYEVAPRVYRRYFWNPSYHYDVDDFTQDSALEIYRLYEEKYISPQDADKELGGLVYTLLNTHFVFNQYDKIRRQNTHSVNKVVLGQGREVDSTGTLDIDTLTHMSKIHIETPETFEYLKQGHQVILDIIDREMSFTSVKGRTHTYEGQDLVTGETITLSEKSVANLIIEGMVPQDVIRFFGHEPEEGTTPTTHIRKIYRDVITKFRSSIATKDLETVKLITYFLETTIGDDITKTYSTGTTLT